MKKILSYRPSASMVVAIGAVILACAGSATAARLITGKQIKNNSVTSSDVKNNSLRSKDVRNRSLLRKDFKRGQLPRGPQGPRGLTGARGPSGSNGFGLLVYAAQDPSGDPVVVADGSDDVVSAVCPVGTFPTGGDAFAVDDATGNQDVTDEVIQSDAYGVDNDGIPAGWVASVHNAAGGTGAVDVFVDAICANASQLGAAARSHHLRGHHVIRRR